MTTQRKIKALIQGPVRPSECGAGDGLVDTGYLLTDGTLWHAGCVPEEVEPLRPVSFEGFAEAFGNIGVQKALATQEAIAQMQDWSKPSTEFVTIGGGDDMTLAEFLLARIAEDEAVARELPPHSDGTVSVYTGSQYVRLPDPDRVLSECEAKRRIVEEITETFEMNRPPSATNSEAVWLGESVLQLLALPYADHPDYREEWKP